MQILVTGGCGRIGRYVVQEFLQAGHTATAVDILTDRGQAYPTLRADLTDAGEVYQSLAYARAEAVIHMGAWANAGLVPHTRTYGDNVRGTFNVLQACADMGIKRVIVASSAQVYGLHQAPPVYLPLDEAHPLRPVNCYALAKLAGEQAAEYFVSNYGLTVLSFRLMGVRAPAEMGPQLERMRQHPAGDARLLWTRTDARDAALACRLAVEREEVASGPYNIAGPCVALPEETATLVARHFGARTALASPLEGHASPMRCAKAEAAFGYRPRYAWTVEQRHPEGKPTVG